MIFRRAGRLQTFPINSAFLYSSPLVSKLRRVTEWSCGTCASIGPCLHMTIENVPAANCLNKSGSEVGDFRRPAAPAAAASLSRHQQLLRPTSSHHPHCNLRHPRLRSTTFLIARASPPSSDLLVSCSAEARLSATCLRILVRPTCAEPLSTACASTSSLRPRRIAPLRNGRRVRSDRSTDLRCRCR